MACRRSPYQKKRIDGLEVFRPSRNPRSKFLKPAVLYSSRACNRRAIAFCLTPNRSYSITLGANSCLKSVPTARHASSSANVTITASFVPQSARAFIATQASASPATLPPPKSARVQPTRLTASERRYMVEKNLDLNVGLGFRPNGSLCFLFR